jgi:hypothetical protein
LLIFREDQFFREIPFEVVINGPTEYALTLRGYQNSNYPVLLITRLAVATVRNLAITGNRNTDGFTRAGGIYSRGTLTLENVRIYGNFAPACGGGIDAGGILELRNSSVTDNEAFSCGGGLAVYPPGSKTLINTIVSGNTAGLFEGGGVFVGSGPLTLSKKTCISGNAPDDIDITSSGTLIGSNCQ